MRQLMGIGMLVVFAVGCAVGCGQAAGELQASPAWFQLDDAHPEDEDGALTGYRLRAGHVGAAAAVDIALPADAFAIGPQGDDLVVGWNDGRQSQLELVDAASGQRHVIVASEQVLRRAVLDPSGAEVYVLVLDQATRAELGVFRFDVDGRTHSLSEGEAVLPPLAADRAGEEVFGPTFATSLRVTDDGGTLVVQSCGEILCRTRIKDLDTGAVVMRDELGQGEVLYATADSLVVWEAANGWPAKVMQIDVASGEATELAFAYGASVARDVAGRATLVWESGDVPGTLLGRPLDVQSLDEAAPRTLAVFGGEELHPVPHAAMALSAVALPDGLVALGMDGRVGAVGEAPRPWVLRLDDGALFEIVGENVGNTSSR